jgi:hypothetical protein
MVRITQKLFVTVLMRSDWDVLSEAAHEAGLRMLIIQLGGSLKDSCELSILYGHLERR